jgi:uncharacterized membrane protein
MAGRAGTVAEPGHGPGTCRRGPEEVLRLRYARGELSREEFLQANADLAGPGPTAP